MKAPTAALVPPFFNDASSVRRRFRPSFVAEFHDLGAQIGRDALPGRGLVVLHRGEESNPVVFAMSTSYMAVALAALLVVIFGAFEGVDERHEALFGGRHGTEA